MNIYDFFPLRILIGAAYAVVTTLNDLLEPVVGAGGAAMAIVLLTVAVRILLIPVGISQVKAGIARQRLAPQIAELQRRHKKNPDLLQRKMVELYAAEKASPFAGCLPVLAQAPIVMAVYGLFVHPTIDGRTNELLAHTFFGVPLDSALMTQIGAGTVSWASGAVFVSIIVLIAIVAQTSRRFLMQPPMTTPSQRPTGDPDLTGLMRALSFMPFMTAAMAAFVPLAAALYLLTTTVWTLGERLILGRMLGTPRRRGAESTS